MGTVLAVAALVAGGCGDSSDTHFSDKQIIAKLDLDETGKGYAIDGDPFCEIDGRLLNDADEVQKVAEDDKPVGIVIASREGNVGVIGLVPFAPDCRDSAANKLKRLDPKPPS
jgi:hypothetical protein